MNVPISMIQDDLPPNVFANEALPGMAVLVFRSLSCEKLAVNGSDVAPAQLFALSTPIRPLAGSAQAADEVDSFVFELRAGTIPLREAFAARKIHADEATVVVSSVPFPITLEVVTCKVAAGAVDRYTYVSDPSRGTRSVSLRERLYFQGEKGLVSLSTNQTSVESAGLGQGAVTMAVGSTAAQVLSGAATAPILGLRVITSNWLIDTPSQSGP